MGVLYNCDIHEIVEYHAKKLLNHMVIRYAAYLLT